MKFIDHVINKAGNHESTKNQKVQQPQTEAFDQRIRKATILKQGIMKTIRNLSGIYFRVGREDKWESICFEDLPEDEQNHMMENKNLEWHKAMIRSLSKVINDIGEKFDIITWE